MTKRQGTAQRMRASPPKRPAASPFATQADRTDSRRRKREALLLAAVRMFNERGYHATSLDDVAASLGVTKPTIYRYLGNKEAVIFECLRRGLDELNAAAALARRQEGRSIERLRMFLCHYAHINMNDFGRCTIRTGEEYLGEESAAQIRAMKRQVDATLRELIAGGIADGDLRPVNVTYAAFALAGALNWPARWFDPAGADTPENVADALIDILLNGLREHHGGEPLE